MTYHRLRWALLCVAATYGALLATSAEASQTVVIKRGDSIDSLARQHNVAKRDIARANGISEEAVLYPGKRLIIPDPPRTVVHPATMRRAARIHGNRISIRRGPYEGHRRITLLDHGAPLVVTRRAGDWFQVELPGGTIGWVRSDFVALGSSQPASLSSAERPKTRRVARVSSESRAARTRDRKAAQKEPRQSARRSRVAARRAIRTASTSKSRRSTRSASITRRRTRPEAEAPEIDSDVIRTAYAYRGTRYRYGGSSRGGFDCSGFTSHVYRRAGVNLPHSSSAQFRRGRKVSSDEMKAGDLVFFSTTRRGISHVGIYVGDGKFIHASSGGGSVRVDTLRSGYYKDRFRGARRVK